MSAVDGKYAEPSDELVEHYAKIIVEDGRAPDLPMARLMVDMSGDNGMLGRITEADVAKGHDPRYVRLRALALANLLTEEERAEWHQATEQGPEDAMDTLSESTTLAQTQRYVASEEEMADLREHLWEIRRISEHEKTLKEAKTKHTKASVPILKAIGSVMIADPIDGNPRVTNVIEAETLVVDAGKLLKALTEHYGDEDVAHVVWSEVLKPPAVDTKDEGLFHQATRPRGENGDLPPLIPAEVVARVASFKKSAAYIGFSKPGG